MLDGRPLIDAHVHAPRLPTLSAAWTRWAHEFGHGHDWPAVYDTDGTVVPELLDAHFEAQGADHVILLCEYSPKATGIQPVEDLLPIVKHNPDRFRFLANVNPHLHHPLGAEVERQVALGACGLKLHPVHGGFACSDPQLYPAYEVCARLGLPVVVHCGTSSFPGSTNAYADPVHLDTVLRDFPGLTVVLAHGGRGWWYDAAASLALLHDTVWIELSGLPPRKLPEYWSRFSFPRLARRFVFATDWPGMPGTAANARAFAETAARNGVDEETIALAWAGNARRVYGLGE